MRAVHVPRTAVVLTVLMAWAFVPPAARASEQKPTLDEVSQQVMCPTCETTIDKSNSPVAERMRAYAKARIAEGWTRQQVLDGLAAEYGEDVVLPEPGSDAVTTGVWLLPLLVACALVASTLALARRWSRARSA